MENIYKIIAGLVIIMSLLGVYLIISEEANPIFKIIKERCYNETNENYCWDMIRNLDNMNEPIRNMGCNILKKYGVLEKSIECTLLYEISANNSKKVVDCFENPPIREVCEDVDVKVEEIIFYQTKINKTTYNKCSIDVHTNSTKILFNTNEDNFSVDTKINFEYSNNDNLRMVIEFENHSEIESVSINNQTINTNDCEDVTLFYKVEETISKEDLTIEWLNENCEPNLSYVMVCNKDNVFPKPFCIIEDFEEYSYDDYKVEVIYE